MALSFAAHLDVLPVGGRGLVTVSDRGCEIYSGAAYAELGDLIDGQRDESDLLQACPPSGRQAVADAITALRRAAVLQDTDPRSEPPADAAWWSAQRVSGAQTARRIADAAVRVRTLGDIESGPTLVALAQAGIQICEDAAFELVLVDDYLDAGLLDINEQALSRGRRWMLARPAGTQVLVGPIFTPDAGPCWDCLAQRMWSLRSVERQVREQAGGSRVEIRGSAPRAAAGLGPALIATELTRWLAGAGPRLETMIRSFDLLTWEGAEHQVVWRPQCPACGEAEPPSECRAAPIELRDDSPAADRISLRDAAPETTIRRFEHHISPISGAVQMVRRLHGSDPLHVYVAGGPSARVHGDRTGWESFDHLQAGGKGTTDAAARASALCEALERFSGDFGGEEPRRTASFNELGDAAIHPNAYMRFSDHQYEARDELNRHSVSYRTWIPERFVPEMPIDWSPCWSLTAGRERLLPTALLYYGAHVAGHEFCVAESNGNAAGNTVPEAILHGLLELIERDHVALWWFNRLTAPAVDLDTVADPWLQRLRAHLSGDGRELWALDLTADLGVPVAVAMVSSAHGDRIGIGFGAHIDLPRAVVRAATEVMQLGLGAPSGGLGSGPDDLTLEAYPFLRPSGAPTVAADKGRSEDVLAALELCRAGIERQGIEVLVLDQTRPDVELPVVKVLAPGLRHFWTRFAPGRLYDVPVSLGRLARPHAEEDLTPRAPSS